MEFLTSKQHLDNFDSNDKGADKVLIVCIDNGNIIGTVSVINYINDKDSRIYALYVDENYRKQGIATELLNQADAYAKFRPIRVNVNLKIPQGIREFYLNRGYKIYDGADY